ncbi:MAG: homoserine dehydrogenase, partial [Candidatus Eremiobacteraeota bacterium]|nr:homoserine dehydrogenase [Candidatus Eremiobacteraeota bacterium]
AGDPEPLFGLHRQLLTELDLAADLLDPAFEEMRSDLGQLTGLPVEEGRDRIMGWGELLSSRMMAACLRARGWDSKAATPAELAFVTDDVFQDANVLWDSLEDIARRVIASPGHVVFPGYVGVTADGRRTTLGRGGSDYTAAVMGAALKREVEIWTDVDGVAVTNPTFFDERMRSQGHPSTIERLSHEEAYQMSAFGSRVLYQKCLTAARMAARKGRHLKMTVKNTFNPDHPGTIIESHASPAGVPKGITALEEVQLLTVYLDREEDYRGLLGEVQALPNLRLLMASYSTGRASFVFDRLSEELEALERHHRDAHLSRDQVLVKVVGDGLGQRHATIGRIHQTVDFLDDSDRFGAPLLHKSPQLLTDSTFEAVALKRGARQVILQLYKDLFCQSELTVGMLGLGTVAGGVLEYSQQLFSRRKTGVDLRFPVALVRDLGRPRRGFEGKLTSDARDVIEDPRVDVVVELMGGLEPARTHILAALANGKHVITANKAVLAEHGAELFEAARRHGRNIGFEGSVCGEIPVLEVVQDMPSDQDVDCLLGIFNGTSNYLLSRMASGMSYDEALKQAQDAGFAEADPSLDVGGGDATQKLSILASIVFHAPVPWREILCHGIEGVRAVDTAEAARLGYVVRPVALGRRHPDGLELWVGPVLVGRTHSLYPVAGETCAVSLELTGRSEPFTLVGKGAGALPTARSVVRDLYEVSRRSRHRMVELPAFHQAEPPCILGPERHVYPWWVRFTVKDEPGVFGRLAALLGDQEVSIRQASQTEDGKGLAHVMLMLKPCPRANLERAMAAIRGQSFLEADQVLPVLEG